MNRSRESYAYYKLDKEKTYLFYRLVFINICLYNFLCTGGAKDMDPDEYVFASDLYLHIKKYICIPTTLYRELWKTIIKVLFIFIPYKLDLSEKEFWNISDWSYILNTWDTYQFFELIEFQVGPGSGSLFS